MLYPPFIGVSLIGGKPNFAGLIKKSLAKPYGFLDETIVSKDSTLFFQTLYQMNDGGAQASAKPIYQKFVQVAKKLSPRYLSMIIPARWMTGGKGLDEFREETIHDRHFTILHYYANAEDCFSGVDIKGGVCYFLWERDKEKMCDIYRHDNNGTTFSHRYLVEEDDDIFIRYPQLISIKHGGLEIITSNFILNISLGLSICINSYA